MNYLIDTHIFLWLIYEPEKISSKVLDILKDSKNSVYVTSITFWEISLKYALGKLSIDGLTPDELPKVARKMGIKILNINEQTMSSIHKLSHIENHKNPFDRLIIWHCIENGYVMVSHDTKFEAYTKMGLRCIR